MTDNSSQIDNTGSYYSVNVPAPDMQTYLRLGQPDTSTENTLKTTPDAGTITTVNGFDSGILLYTQGHYQQVAPAFTAWSADSLSAVTEGNVLVSASYTSTYVPSTYNYSLQAQFNTAIGDVSNFVTGNQLAYWVINSASTGLGGLLWSNIGLTQNVFFGQIVNVINNNIDVQGAGEAKVQSGFEVLTSTSIDLLLAPAATVSAAAMAGSLRTTMTIVTAGISAILVLANDMGTGLTGDLTSDPNKLRNAMVASASELAAATALLFVLQIVVASAGRVVKAAAELAKGTAPVKIGLIPTGITLTAGASRLMITDAGIYLAAPLLTNETTMNEVAADLTQFTV